MIAQDINITLDDCRLRLSPELFDKVNYSVNLLRRAASIATAYDPENGYYLAFSGGKDSQCLYHIAKIAGVPFRAYMTPTTVDPGAVIRFVRLQYPDVELVKPRESIYTVAVRKHILPTRTVRWCCAEFKENAGAGKVTLIGIRHAESVRRSKRNEVEISNRQYSGNLDGLDDYRRKRRGATTIINATGERTLGCIQGKETLLISPIIYWTDADVWEFLNGLHIPHCGLYDKGQRRIGCLCCPMATKHSRNRDIANYPYVKRNWISAIRKMRQNGDLTTPFVMVEEFIKQRDKTPNKPLSDQQEQEMCEYIFDWWVSGENSERWFADNFLQQRINFD